MIHLLSCSVPAYVYSCIRMVNLNPHGKHCYQVEYYTYVQFLLPQSYILGLFPEVRTSPPFGLFSSLYFFIHL